MIKVIFSYRNKNTVIEAKQDEILGNIIEKYRFITNLNNIFFLYNGKMIKEELRIEKIGKIGNLGKKENLICIQVIDINSYIICEFDVEDNNSDIRIINSYEECKRELLIGERENDYEFQNEEELKENCQIKIDEQIIPFSYLHKFNEKGKHVIQYSFFKNPTKINHLFCLCKSLKFVDFTNFDSKNVVNMSNLFSTCTKLNKVKFTNFNTQNVTNMSFVFDNCISLQFLDLSSFDTNKVTDMSFMFDSCQSLLRINISNFNTQKVDKMNGMFSNCKDLKEINLSNFDTRNVRNMSWMFTGCISLTYLNLSNFITKEDTDTTAMFYGCNSLLNLNVDNFCSKKFDNIFIGCSILFKK